MSIWRPRYWLTTGKAPVSRDALDQGTSQGTDLVPNPNSGMATMCWSAAAILLAFFVFAQIGVLLCFCAGRRVSPLVAPAALLLALHLNGCSPLMF